MTGFLQKIRSSQSHIHWFQLSIVSLFILIFLGTRLLWLGNLPAGLHADEASFLLNSVSLLETGKDEDGNVYPIWLSSYIDSKPALYSYFQIPSIAVLGTNTFSSRLPAVAASAVSLIIFYLLAKQWLTKEQSLVLSTVLLLSPWHIVVSRSTQEVIVSFTFSLATILLFELLHKKKTNRLQTILVAGAACLFALLAMYMYHAAKVFLPALLLSWTFFDYFETKKIHVSRTVVSMSVALLMLGLTFGLAQSTERFQAIGIFSDQGYRLISNEQTLTASNVTPLFFIRAFYNKVVTTVLAIGSLYTQHFTADFLFWKGGEPQRYLIPYHGLMYHVELFLLPAGMFFGLHTKKTRTRSLKMLIWLLLAPLPAALTTQEIPSMIRSFFMIVPLTFFVWIALLEIWKYRAKWFRKILMFCVFLGYIWGFAYFIQQSVVQQPRYHPWNRNQADTNLTNRLLEIQDNYDKIIVTTNRDLYAYLTLAQQDMIPYLQEVSSTRKAETFTFGKYHFEPGECRLTPPEENDTQSILYVIRAGCVLPKSFTHLEYISYNDNAKEYQLVIYEPLLEDNALTATQ